MQLQNFDVAAFLRDHWQKKPLLIRGAWPDWRNPLEPDELAGLACEEGVESRLIQHERDAWSLEHGPVAEERFTALGEKPWTLLVQAVDHHVPEVAALIERFRFVPNWRIDDVMVSYANAGGGVGPHFDHYDVFLIQGLGRRRWQVGAHCDAATALLPHEHLRLVAEFAATDDWILEPGDMLYVPPGIAHNGVAVSDDCMTYSIGFRAPAAAEVVSGWGDAVAASLTNDDRYADPDLAAQDNPGEITPAALARLHAIAATRLADRDAFARWFGQHDSTRKYPDIDWTPEAPMPAAEMRAMLAGGVTVCRNPASRFSFIRRDGDAVMLFVDGICFDCTGAAAAFARELCARDRFDMTAAMAGADDVVATLTALYNQGSVAFEREDQDA